MKRHIRTALRPEIIRTATRFALIVGPILVMINHGDVILAGQMDMTAWLKSLLTMIVPYTVSTLSSISAYHSCQVVCDGEDQADGAG